MPNSEKSLILMVDDNLKNLQVLGNLLEGIYRTASVVSSAEALAFVKRKRPDLILLDIMMPDMDGYHTCRILHEQPETCDIPVIFLTAKRDTDDVVKGFKIGAVDYIIKPFNSAELLVRVKTHLALKKSREQHQIAMEALEVSKLKLDAVFQNIPEGIIMVDENMRVIQHNKMLEQICPLFKNITLDTPLPQAMQNCEGKCLKILKDTLTFRKQIREYHVSCSSGDGSEKNLILNCSPLLEENRTFEGALLVIRDITQLRVLEEKLKERHSFKQIIGKAKSMQHIYDLVEQVADVESTVLITGESGTGKEVVMEAIHNAGIRSKGPLVRINCSVLPENIMESELFGHVRGAYTGAVKDRIGRAQLADGGTLFLDEIGDLSPFIQLKLLRFLERKEYERVGDSKTFKADVRIIAATHVDLAERVRQGQFREDFFYRLKVMEINLPPLRERTEDIPLLVKHFCDFFSKQFNKQITGVSDSVLALFMRYPWPGNIRELKHALEHAFILCSSNKIGLKHLPAELFFDQKSTPALPDTAHDEGLNADIIRSALDRTYGNKAQAAKLLGMHRSTLYRKLLEFGIQK